MKRVLAIVAVAIAALGGAVALSPAASAATTSAVHGTVTGPGGAALAGVTVELERSSLVGPPTIAASTTTAADGTYAMAGFGPGSYVTRFRPADAAIAAHQEHPWFNPGEDRVLDVALQLGGSVRGSLVAPAGGPAQVTVRFMPAAGGPIGSTVITVGSTPVPYISPALEPGTYTVRFDPDPASSLAFELFPDSYPWSPTSISVTAGGSVTGIDASLEQSVTIDGHLRSSSGQPVAGAQVSVQSDRRWQPAEVTTDSNGAWRLVGLRSGQQTLAFRVGNMVVATYPVTVDGGGAHGIDATVTAGQIEGRIVGPSGPVNASVYLSYVGAPNLNTYGSTVDGRFTLYASPGSYQISISPHDSSVASGYFWYHGLSQQDSESVTVASSQIVDVGDVRLPAAAAVRGRVTGPDGVPIQSLVIAQPLDGGSGNLSHSGADGTYEIGLLGAGRFTVVADPDGLFGGPFYLGDVTSSAQAANFTLVEGQTLSGQDFHFPTGTSALRIAAAAPSSVVAGSTAILTLSGAGFDRLHHDGMSSVFASGGGLEHLGGTFTVLDDGHLTYDLAVPAGFAPGTYDLGVYLDAGSGPNTQLCVGCLTITAPPPPPPPPPPPTPMPVVGAITGKVKDSSGRGIAGAVVQAIPTGAAPSGSDPTATADANGMYRLTAPVGSYALHILAGPSYISEWYRNATSQAAAKVLTVTAGQTVSGIDVGLAKAKSAAGPLSVTSVKPVTVVPGTAVAAVVKGTGFKANGVTGLAFSASGGVSVTVTKVVSDTTANVDLTAAPTAPAGARDVTVTRDGGATATCAGCLTVGTAPPPAGPTITGVAPASLVAGSTVGVDLTGTGLGTASAATIDGTGVTVKAIVSATATKVRVRVAVDASAAPGPRTLTLLLSGGAQVTTTLVVS